MKRATDAILPTVGKFATGANNAVTDVPGVRVGHVTLVQEPDVHTGVTAIVPPEIGPNSRLPAGFFCGNGRGKFIGSTQIQELGEIESPIVLTGTLSAFRAADALVTWMLNDVRNDSVLSFNPVVGECNDGHLSDVRGRPVREEHVLEAIESAAIGPVAEGCVGAGTGTVALGYKAGIGTASRVVGVAGQEFTVGVLIQANFGGRLRLGGVEVPAPTDAGSTADGSGHGSCVIVVATDAPVDARQLTRVARRAIFALSRVGSAFGHESGDYAVAFSVSRSHPAPREPELSSLFEATMDAVEEAVIHSLLAAHTVHGRGGATATALDLG